MKRAIYKDIQPYNDEYYITIGINGCEFWNVDKYDWPLNSAPASFSINQDRKYTIDVRQRGWTVKELQKNIVPMCTLQALFLGWDDLVEWVKTGKIS